MTDRFKPTRAGVINVWDYVDEEWAFADGRLALRGHNGSGKTKALEVLFPFVLDGQADSRRLDPFSGENRTMKSNLLFRGQDSEYGYCWTEFANRAGETVTLIIGMRAHRNTDGVRMSFFVTRKRLGRDFGLLSADSRPLTDRQLKAVLEPGAHRKTATEYRDLIDQHLFGLGRERYMQLLDLLLALRRPLLAKDLDPGKVSDTLTSGLSPVDDDLVQQAARDFENLAAVQKLFDDLTTANAAVADFRAHYESYLRSHVKFALDRVRAREETAAAHASAITVAARAQAEAAEAEAAAAADRDAQRERGEKLAGRLAGLKNSEEYKAQGRIADKREQTLRGAREIGKLRGRLADDKRRIDGLEREKDKLARRVAEARAGTDRSARELADAGERSGIAGDGSGPLDPGAGDGGADLLVTAKARSAARRGDVAEVRAALKTLDDAKARHGRADTELGRATTAEDEQRAAAEAADAALAAARETAAAELTAWTQRWPGLEETGPALTGALEQAGEAGAASLAEVFDAGTRDRQAEVIAERADLKGTLRDTETRIQGLRAERDAIAAEKDDAPPASDLRPASRDGRPGAPLWQLVRFADGVGDTDAAGIEGALYGAGLLTAWLHPDPSLTTAALAAAEADGYLVPDAPVSGRSLADVLVPEEQDHVPAGTVTAVLRSITLASDLSAGDTVPAVSTRAQFSYGVHAGARPKEAPEYIGATNRANRRRARLAEYEELIAGAVADSERVAASLAKAGERLEDFRRARGELPRTRPVAKAAEAAGRSAALLTRAVADTETARKTLDTAIAEADAAGRQLRQAAAERRLPADAGEIDSVAAGIADFERAAAQLHTERGQLAQAEEDLAERAETIERTTGQYAEDEAALTEEARQQEAREEELRTLEATLGADVRQVLEQIGQTEREITDARTACDAFDQTAGQEHDKATAAGQDLRNERQSLAEAVTQLHEQAAAFGDYARPDLRPLVGAAVADPWPDPAAWPEPARAAADLADALASGADPGILSTLPPAVPVILGAFTAAVRGGRQVTEGTLKNSADRMSVALKDFTEALAACDEDYRVDWEPGAVVTVHVIDDEGRKPVADFAARIGDRAADQGVLLEDRERKVLEDELLASLAQQIHARVIAARDLTASMNADTRSKPMSSGISIGIRWGQSDKITDLQRQASRLLERDTPGTGRLAELRGLLRDMIREYRGEHPRATYREALAGVLDYRSWHAFELMLITPGEADTRLTRAKHSVMSGGEKSAAIHLPLFAAANALYSSAGDQCPRMIALDEAFVGIDERYKPDLFGLAVKFDLDLFMTGHDLWVTTAAVPMIAHYDLYHDKSTRTTSALLLLWDGESLIDSAAGYADTDTLVTQLLGFRPTRHAPLATDSTLYSAVSEPAPDDEEDQE